MPPSTRCRPSSSSALAEMIYEISETVKHLIKKASPALLSFTTSMARFWKAEQKVYANFRRVRGLGYMTVSEMLGGNAGE